MDKTEVRDLTTQEIEVREENDNRTISGYAVRWNSRSRVMGLFKRFQEEFRKGAFADSLESEDQRFLWSHDTSKVLGRTKNNTLRLFEDELGLRFELDLPDTTLGDDSFGFKKEEDEWVDGDVTLRSITKAKLLEVSAVAFPAYPDSGVSARGFDPVKQYEEEIRAYDKEQASKIKLLTYL